MKRGQRRALIALGIIVAVVIVASVALRLILTKERLTALLVPRIERAVGAEIELGDIAIRFPFGFGVTMKDLRFTRPTQSGGKIVFSADDLGVDVSLMSLIRRRPEIQSVRAGGASVVADPGGGAPVIELDEIEARLSMRPSDTVYVLDPRVTAGAVLIEKPGSQAAVRLPAVSFSGTVETSLDFQRVRISGGELSIAGLAAFSVEGSVSDLDEGRDFTADVRAADLDAAKLLDAILSIDVSGLKPGMTPEKMRESLPVAIEGGTVGLDVTASGSGAAPSQAKVDGTMRLGGVTMRSPAFGLPLKATGTVGFSMDGAAADGIIVEAGRSRAELSFKAPLEGEPKKPGTIEFAASARADIGEIAAAKDPSKPAPTGSLEAKVSGSGSLEALKGLFPPATAPPDPEAMRKAWSSVRLAGNMKISGLEPPATDTPVRLSGINASAKISGGDVTGLEASMRLGGSPWKVTGDLRGILPALAGLGLLARADVPPKTPGEALKKLAFAPDISMAVTGRSFDAVPFQEAAKQKKETAGTKGAGGAAKAPQVNPLAENPVTLLLLKKTSVSVSVDSVIARGAVLTEIKATARLVDGMLRADPVSLRYAGGTGRGTVQADLSDPSRIPSSVDLDFTGVQAGQALSGLTSAGGMVGGAFSFSLEGSFDSGPGIDVLKTLTAAGNAASTKGNIDLSRFTAPLKASGIALPFAEQFSFDEWTEKFTIEAGRVATELWQIRSGSGDWDIAGSFGFDGTIDYRAKLLLTPAMQSRMKDLDKYRDLVDLFRDDTGNLVFEFDVGGTAKSPKMQLDQTKARQKAGEKLIEGAQKKLLDMLKKK
jgi:hypothetical protein